MERKITNPYYTYGLLYVSEALRRWETSQGTRYREYRQAWAQRTSKLDPGDFPLNLNVEVTNRCNLACTFCPQPTLTPDQLTDMPMELYQALIEEGARHNTPAANLNGLGEPMLLRHLPEMIRHAKQKGYIDVMFHTNGTLMTEALAQALIETGLDRIIFSVDSPDKQTYEEMRLRSNWERVVSNVRLFWETRNKMGRSTPLIRTTMVVTDRTVHQVPDFVLLWKPVADQITLQDLTWRTKLLEDSRWVNREQSAIPIDMEAIREEAKRRKISFVCPYLYQSSYAYGNGDVIPCSNPNARKHMVMGRFDQQGIAAVWKGKSYTELRELHSNGRWDEHPICRDCEIPLIELYKALDKETALPVASDLAPADGSGADLLMRLQSERKSP